MCKRFIDTGLWKQSWFLDLSPELKLIWQYLTVNCDTAGIWKIDIRQLMRDTGVKDIDLDGVVKEINKDYDPHTGRQVNVNRIVFISGKDKLWITGYISFQNEKGKNGVNAGVPAIKGAINRLRDEGILDYAIKNNFVRVNNYIIQDNNNQGCQPLVTDKDKDKGMNACCSSSLTEEEGAGEETKTPPESASNEMRNTGKGFPQCTQQATSTQTLSAVPVVVPVYPPEVQQSAVERIYSQCSGRMPRSPAEIKSAEDLLKEFGEEEFSFALRQSLEHKKTSIAYLRGILRNRKEKAAAEKEKEEARKKQQELQQRIEQERKAGVKLNLIEQVYGKQK